MKLGTKISTSARVSRQDEGNVVNLNTNRPKLLYPRTKISTSAKASNEDKLNRTKHT